MRAPKKNKQPDFLLTPELSLSADRRTCCGPKREPASFALLQLIRNVCNAIDLFFKRCDVRYLISSPLSLPTKNYLNCKEILIRFIGRA